MGFEVLKTLGRTPSKIPPWGGTLVAAAFAETTVAVEKTVVVIVAIMDWVGGAGSGHACAARVTRECNQWSTSSSCDSDIGEWEGLHLSNLEVRYGLCYKTVGEKGETLQVKTCKNLIQDPCYHPSHAR